VWQKIHTIPGLKILRSIRIRFGLRFTDAKMVRPVISQSNQVM
jgi:hypothetical protein